MDKERSFEELLVPPIGISEAEEDKKTEGGIGEMKQRSKPIAAFVFTQKKKTVTVFKKKEKK